MIQKDRRLIGLALSGGGARGLAHIGVLKVLEDEGIPVDLIAGTSMGGVVAATYASGLTPDFLEQESLRMASPRRLLALVDLSVPRRGFVAGRRLCEYLAPYLGGRTFAGLRIPLTLVAVDLNCGRKVYLRQGQVLEAVRATIAMPGVLRPVERGDQLLVDGGLLDNLPADAVREMGADVVIAVDISTDAQAISRAIQSLHRRRYFPNGLADAVEVLWRSVGVMATEINRQRLAEVRPEVVIRPPIPPEVNLFTGFTHAAEIIAIGEQAAREALPDIRRALELAVRGVSEAG